MTNKKRARENARKRQAEYERRQAELAAQRRVRARRAWIVAGCFLGGAAVITLAAIVVTARSQPDASPTASPSVTAGSGESQGAYPSESSSATPSATASDEGIELSEGWQTSPEPPDPSYADGRDWSAVLHTNQGDITITLDGKDAPQATAAFTKLAQDGYYNETDCHRLTTDGPYLLQCGTASGTGADRAGFTFGPLENVPENGVYKAGDVVMVRDADDADSMSSQFQIMWKDSTLPGDSAGGFTVVGKVTDGLSILGGIAQAGTITGDPDGWPAVSVIINEVTIE